MFFRVYVFSFSRNKQLSQDNYHAVRNRSVQTFCLLLRANNHANTSYAFLAEIGVYKLSEYIEGIKVVFSFYFNFIGRTSTYFPCESFLPFLLTSCYMYLCLAINSQSQQNIFNFQGMFSIISQLVRKFNQCKLVLTKVLI